MSNIKLSIQDYDFSLDGYFYNNLMIIKDEAIPNDWDGLIIVHGKEGAGKTTLATQAAITLDFDYNIDGTVWRADNFEELIDNCKPESSILWDEAITGATATQWANSVSQAIITKLTIIRKKKLKIIICFPYLWMLNKYFVSRCVASVYVYAKGFKDRGHAFFYNQEQTEYIYALMKEKYRLSPSKAYNVGHKSFYFRYRNVLCLPEKEYQKRKDEASKSIKPEEKNVTKKYLRLVMVALHDEGWTFKKIGKLLGCGAQNINRYIHE